MPLLRQSIGECPLGRPAFLSAALARPLGVVVDGVGVGAGPHLLDGLVPLLAAPDTEVLVERGFALCCGAVQTLDTANRRA